MCSQLESGVVRELDLRIALGLEEISVATQDQLIACLKDAGIVFPSVRDNHTAAKNNNNTSYFFITTIFHSVHEKPPLPVIGIA